MGVWQTESKKNILNWVDPKDKSGEFKRQTSVFRNFISAKPGAEFPPEKGRYHLYVSYACPWAHRTLIVRKLKGLEDFISYTSVHWEMLEKGMSAEATEGVDVCSRGFSRMAICNSRREGCRCQHHSGPVAPGVHSSARHLF